MSLVCEPVNPVAVPTDRFWRDSSRRENSNLIQITSRDMSVWRGKIWSAVTFKIKVDDYFVRDDDDAPYTLRPMVVNATTHRQVDESDLIKLEFGKNTLPDDRSVATVTSEPHNAIEAEFHQDLFEHGDSFYLEVEANRENDTEVIFGRSPTMVVTNFALAIEQGFLENPFVAGVKGNMFEWYNKCGGDKACLSATFHLKDETGRVVNTFDDPMKLKTELVYDDGSPTPLMPMAPLKARRSTRRSELPLYRPLVPDPALEPGQGSVPFSFRIEEVSFHHPGHAGFKLKVSPANPEQHLVHPGLLEETIVVLSKPKHDSTKTKKRGGRVGASIALTDLDDEEDLAPKPSKARRVSTIPGDVKGGALVTVSTSALVDLSRQSGKCRFCAKRIRRDAFFCVESHRDSCKFSAKVLDSASPAAEARESNTKAKARTEHTFEPTVAATNFEVCQMQSLAKPTATQATEYGYLNSSNGDAPVVHHPPAVEFVSHHPPAPAGMAVESVMKDVSEPMVVPVQAPSIGILSELIPYDYSGSDESDSLEDFHLFDIDESEAELLASCSQNEEEMCTHVESL